MLWKNIFRTLGASKGRFVSIACLVALGSFALVGLQATGPDMRSSLAAYTTSYGFTDLYVMGDLGLDEDDVAQIEALDGVQTVEFGYLVDVEIAGSTDSVRVQSTPQELSCYELVEGRMPEAADEIALGSSLAGSYELGDTIEVVEPDADDDSAVLTTHTFTVVGFVNSSEILGSSTMGSSTVGTGTLTAYAVAAAEAFDTDYYMVARLSFSDTSALDPTSQEYLDLVAEHKEEVEEALDGAGERRYTTVCAEYEDAIAEGESDIADAEAELADAEAELDDAEAELADAAAELDDAEAELDDAAAELEDAAAELVDAEAELASAAEELDATAEELADARAELEDAAAELADGTAEVAAAEAELAAAEAEIASGEEELAAAAEELAANEAVLAAAKAELDASAAAIPVAEAEIAEGASALAAAQEELAAAQEAYDDGSAQYEEGLATYQVGLAAYEEGLAAAAAAEEELAAAKAELDAQAPSVAAAEEEIAQGQEELAAAQEELAAAQAGYEANEALYGALLAASEAGELDEAGTAQMAALAAALEEAAAQIEAAAAQIAENEAALAAAQAQVDAYYEGLAAYEAGAAELAVARASYEAAEAELAAGKEELAQAASALAAAQDELESGQTAYDEGVAAYEAGVAAYDEGVAAYGDGVTEYEQGKASYEDGLAAYEEGKASYEDGLAEYEDGLAEYEDARAEYDEAAAEAEVEIADARAELADAREALSELEVAQVSTMNHREFYGSNGYTTYVAIYEMVDSVAAIFPAFFYLVAALVISSTMTRMVDEERACAGTLKALGYTDGDVLKKFLFYGAAAASIGAAVGIVSGHLLLPYLIYQAFASYFTLPDLTLSFYPLVTAAAVAIAFTVTLVPTAAAAKATATEKPALLMQPKAPASGSKILLERITPIWSRLSFTYKVTARNLFRYKVRALMTILGVLGSVGLIFFGFAVTNSIGGISERQFGEILGYDLIVAVDEDATVDELAEVETLLQDDDITGSTFVAYESASCVAGSKNDTQNIYLFSAASIDELAGYINVYDNGTGELLELPAHGAIISKRLSTLAGVDVGDILVIEDADGEEHEVEVAGVCEMYIEHFLFMSDAAYEELFGSEPEDNAYLVDVVDELAEDTGELAAGFIAAEAVTGVVQNSASLVLLDTFVVSMNIIMVILIVVSIMLACVIVYNLVTISVAERIRELSTIKVLGFYNDEVTMYIYRETIALSALAVPLGWVFGWLLQQYLINAVPPDRVMFDPDPGVTPFIISTAVLAAVVGLMGLVVYRRLKRVDMLEALKSVD